MNSKQIHIITLVLIMVFFSYFPLTAECQNHSLTNQTEDNSVLFPSELIDFEPWKGNPIFTATGSPSWDVKIRERGWILKENDGYHLWFTGYDGTRQGIKNLGYATSQDGIKWDRHPNNPISKEHWIEDMMVVKKDNTYYMFAEGLNDHTHLFSSTDKLNWKLERKIDIRYTNGAPLSPGPYGTPTAWFEDNKWYLFYERKDQGIWLASSTDMKIWTHIQDEPVITLGPDEYDNKMIAINQIIKHKGSYYTYYHGLGKTAPYDTWTSSIAVSKDLIHWKKYSNNPILQENKSSSILIKEGDKFRLYSMHNQVHLHLPKTK